MPEPEGTTLATDSRAEPSIEEKQPEPKVAETEPGAQQEQDYKALYEQEKAARAKEAENHRAQRIALLKQAERDKDSRETKEMLGVVIEHLDEGDGRLKQKLATVRQGTSQQEASEEFLSQANALALEAEAIAKEFGLDLQKAPELDDARRSWRQASDTKDRYWLADARAELLRAKDKAKDAKHAQELGAKEKAANERIKKRLAEAGVNDLNPGTPAGSAGSPSLASLLKKDTSKMSPGEAAKYILELDAARR